ncbi:acyl-CoA thioesterase [Nocardioides bizhenqiangii]|uniref:Thioesterase family protein n=1 Tax=Nocardioides bizhenqiangii TaxID=3095076 RepID=A0ABZ0ZUL9_9ACTN|nr:MULTISPECIES: thioesterase family protein [unclassified Nocardioides]MDZ5623667.1 thioesterase family protein [Nocardioides sp. HM23]WQQ27765.1 thioesterase family protein [Nocardioides sp. HM61]
MRHRYACPIRWADLDLLGHVNNVRYVDYLQEARVDLLRAHRWSGPAEATESLVDAIIVIRHEVTYRAPLLFGERPVLIECWVTQLRAGSFTLAYEVFHEDEDGARVVYLEASTVLAPFRFDTESPRRLSAEERAALEPYLEPVQRERPAPLVVDRVRARRYPVQVRFSDVDVYRHVNNVVYFEYFQEARIRLFMELGRGVSRARTLEVVVARTDVDYLAPITLRADAYDCWTQVAHVGRTSLVIESEIADGDRALARARVVLVFFDPETQRPTEPPADYQARLRSALA